MQNITNMIRLKPRCGYGWLIEMENQITARVKLGHDQFLEFDWSRDRLKDARYSAHIQKRDMTGQTLSSTVVALEDNEPIFCSGNGEVNEDRRLSVDAVANLAAEELNVKKR